MVKRRWTDQQLIDAVSTSVTYTEVVKKLGLSTTAAGNWRTAQKYVKLLGLDTSHFLTKAENAARMNPPERRVPLDQLLVEDGTATSFNLKRRLINEGIKAYACESCGLSEWEGEVLPLELDHVNGIKTDNRLENLRILCPNCHALTPTWRGRNIKFKKA